MLSHKQLSTCILIILLFSLLSCSADKKEFEKIQIQLTNAENVASSTTDYDVQLKACDNSIKTLQEYIAKYPKSEWTESAKLSLASWESKKKSFELKADENTYKKINAVIEESEKIINSSSDYDIQLKACDNSIQLLQQYINEYPNSEWTESAKLSIASWKSKKKLSLASWESNKRSIELKADENTFNKINAVVAESEKIINSSYDFDIIFDAYKNVINTLDGFITQYPNSDWLEQAKLSLSSWKTKVVSFNNEVLQLKSSLNQKLKSKCMDVANKRHGMSKIEELTLEKDSTTKSGDLLKTVHTYRVKMRGKILGTHVFNFQLKVSGNTNMKTKTISVNDETEIIE